VPPRPRFGTDGLRGVANEDLDAELVLALGRAAARVLQAPRIIVGRDTRRSGAMLAAALSAGFASEGVDVVDVGVMPTPGVAYLAQESGSPGAVLSASHNPFADNGVKLFYTGGTKLPMEVEQAVEDELDAVLEDGGGPPAGPPKASVGTLQQEQGLAERYVAHLTGEAAGTRLDGMRVLIDGANGSVSALAPRVFEALGADVEKMFCEPDGTNINAQCGSTQPDGLAGEVVARRMDLGLAFDGDGDRLLAVDHRGEVVDGDQLLALFALDMAERGELVGNTVVVTVMSNLGFRLAMADRGIEVKETPVGDRHVLAALEAGGFTLGGEQSGHIVFRRRATTGDGMLTGVLLTELLVRSGQTLAELVQGLVERVPQVLVNVRVADPERLLDATAVWDAVAAIERQLGDQGRVVLRASGTEPLVRVMVESTSMDDADSAAQHLSSVVETSLGGDAG
jgi:phosphoglucosamine mutase